jgi:hypothetical protein
LGDESADGDNIKIDLEEIGCEDKKLQEGALVNTMMIFGFHKRRVIS